MLGFSLAARIHLLMLKPYYDYTCVTHQGAALSLSFETETET